MSYILEALRKSEQERSLGQVPHPGREPADAWHGRRAGRRYWPWLALALAANAGLLAWIALRPAVPPPQQSPAEAGPAVAAVPDSPSPLERQQPRPVPPAPVVQAAPSRGVQVVEEAADQPPGLQPASPPPRPVVEKMPAPAAAVPLPAAAPLWEEMPESFRQRVGRPELEVHFYTGQAARRFVFLEQKKYREGDRLANGLVLEAITPDGAIFDSGGQRFRVERP